MNRKKRDPRDDAKARRSREDNAERQRKPPVPIQKAETGDPDEMLGIGEEASGTQPEIGHKDEGAANPRRRDRA